MPTAKSSLPLFRVPNGIAPQRLRVAVSDELLTTIKADAAKNHRTVSSMASLIIAEYYDAKKPRSADLHDQ